MQSSADHLLEINNILTPHQHGFWKGFSTEIQLISVLDNWLSLLDKHIRTHVILIDFSKVFDSVPHQRLLLKLKYYGITGNNLFWIENFLLDCIQCFQVSGTKSSWTSVTGTSGVPQGTFLGPLLFLMYINDIVHNLSSKIKLFADNAVLYSKISSVHDASLSQQDLDTLSCWATTWQLNFILTKGNLMSITRSPLKSPASYRLCNAGRGGGGGGDLCEVYRK